MGQKIHPEGFRVGYIHDWKSNWFAEKEFADLLMQDLAIRDHIENKLAHAGLSDITIQRRGEVAVDIHTARPGIVIGKSGSEVDALRKDLHKITGTPVKVNIREVKRPELDAKLVAQSIAEQLQNRVAFRRAMKRALTSAMRSGAKGVKVQISGRLGGAEMARTEGVPAETNTRTPPTEVSADRSAPAPPPCMITSPTSATAVTSAAVGSTRMSPMLVDTRTGDPGATTSSTSTVHNAPMGGQLARASTRPSTWRRLWDGDQKAHRRRCSSRGRSPGAATRTVISPTSVVASTTAAVSGSHCVSTRLCRPR